MTIDNGGQLRGSSWIPSGRESLLLISIAIVYFVAARLSLLLVIEPQGIAPIWPPSGIFLASILLVPRTLRARLVITLFLTDLGAELLAGTEFELSLIYAFALSADAAIGSWLLFRFFGDTITFTKADEVLGFFLLSVLISNVTMSFVAAIGAMYFTSAGFWSSWKWWMISDGVGTIVIAPLLVSWIQWFKTGLQDLNPKRLTEALLLSALLIVTLFSIFVSIPSTNNFSPLVSYSALPFLVWAALRFEVRGTTAALFFMATFCVYIVLVGHVDPLTISGVHLAPIEVIQLYILVMAFPLLVLAATVSERKNTSATLAAEGEFLAALLDNINEAIVSCDVNGNLIRFNKAARQLHGLPEKLMPSERWANYYSLFKTDGSTVLRREELPLLQALAGDPVKDFNVLVAPKNKPHRFLVCNGQPLRDSQGNITGAVVAMHDVSDQRLATSALRSSEAMLLSIFKNVQDVIFVIEVGPLESFRFTMMNNIGLAVMGITAEDLIGKDVREIIPEPSLSLVLGKYREAIRTTKTIEWQETTKYPDGAKTGIVKVSPVFNEDGICVQLVGSVSDITAVKLAEEAVRSSEAGLAAAQATAHMGSWEFYPKTGKAVWSAEMYKIFDRDPLSKPPILAAFQELIHPEDREETTVALGRLGSTSPSYQGEFRILRKDGSVVWIEALATYSIEKKGESDETVKLSGTVQVITRRRLAENALRHSKEYAENLIQTANVIFVELDADGCIVQLNNTGQHITGYSASEIMGHNWFDTVVPRERFPKTYEAFEQIKRTGVVPDVFENPILTKNGEERSVLWKSNTIVESGTVTGTISFGIDVTSAQLTEIALQESEANLKLTLQLSRIGLWDWNLEKDTWQATPTYFEMLGYDATEEAQNREVWGGRTHPDDREFVINKMLAIRHGDEKDFDIIFRFRHADGSYRWINSIGHGTEFDEQGKTIRMLGVQIDVTKQREAEKKLQLTLELAKIGMWDWEVATMKRSATPTYFTMLGYSPTVENEHAEPFMERTHPDDLEDVVNATQAIQNGRTTSVDIVYRYRHADGSYRWLNSLGYATEFDESGKATRVLGLRIDVSKEREDSARIVELNAVYQTLNETEKAIVRARDTTDLFDKICDVSVKHGDYALAWVAVPNGEWFDVAAGAGAAASYLSKLRVSTNAARREGQGPTGQAFRTGNSVINNDFLHSKSTQFWHKKGSQFAFTASASFPLTVRKEVISVLNIYSRSGSFSSQTVDLFQTMALDISFALEHLQQQAELKQAIAQLEHAKSTLESRVLKRTAELEEAKERAEASDRVKSSFLATMSHELRTPLNSIIGFTGTMLQGLAGATNEEQTKQLTIVKTAGQHLLELISDVLDISKIEAGDISIRFEDVDLPRLFARIESKYAADAANRGLDFSVTIEPGIDKIESNGRRFEQVVDNLITNALKFTEQGAIKVSCFGQGNNVRVEVSDTGVGISPDDCERIFEEFVQIENRTSKLNKGTGLGLAICRRLVTALGGNIGVESRQNEGSTFYFTIPVRRRVH